MLTWQVSNRQLLAEIWTKVVGEETRWMVGTHYLRCAWLLRILLGIPCDIFSTLVKALPLGDLLKQRTTVLTLLTLGLIWPLCMLEDLSALELLPNWV